MRAFRWWRWVIFAALASCALDPAEDGVASVAQEAVAIVPALPTAECPLAGVAILEAESCGASPDSGLDMAPALNACIDAALAQGRALHLRAGRYEIGAPVRLKSGVTVFGDGPSTVLAARTTAGLWAPGAAAVELLGVRGARVCGLTLDHQGTSRGAGQVLDHTMVLSDATSNLVKNVRFLNPGNRLGAPSGPALLLLAHNTAGEGYDAVGGAGTVEANRVEGCRFELDPSLQMSFAVRLWTNWTQATYPRQVRRNALWNNTFAGSFYWNTVELAGGGTTLNAIEGNSFDGLTLAHVDLDKGASYNTVRGNDVLRAGRAPDSLYCDTLPERATQSNCHLAGTRDGLPLYCCRYPVAAIMDHGADPARRNVGNVVEKNRVWRMEDSAASVADGNDAAVSLQFVRGARVQANELRQVFDGRRGVGLHLVNDVAQTIVAENRIGLSAPAGSRTVWVGVKTGSPSTTDPSLVVWDLTLRANVVVSERQSLVAGRSWFCSATRNPFGGLWGNWVVDGNSFDSAGASASLHTATLLLLAPTITNNTFRGGRDNLELYSPGAFVRGNLFADAALNNLQLAADATLIDNHVLSGPTRCTRGCNAAVLPASINNDFVCP